MLIRLATPSDAEAAGKIYDAARRFMKDNGNPGQWANNYPNTQDVLDGIQSGVSYVCEDDGEIVATFHFEENARETVYDKIYGKWKNGEPYAVIHRIAVKYHGGGIVDFCFEECFKRFPNIKIDTHRNNIPMQRCLMRNGFELCGIVYLSDGSERLAYQKCL